MGTTARLLRSPHVLVGGAALCAALAGALALWPRSPDSVVDYHPPAEDICIVPPARIMAATPWDPASGLDRHAARAVPPQARCPVCGMYPARYPRWASQLIYEDGAAHFFDSPVDLLLFASEPARYDPERASATIAARYLSDYRKGGWIPADEAWLVWGSRVHGPMRGADLPAFASAQDAGAFAAEHGGEVLRFEAIDGERLAILRDSNHSH